MIFDRLADAILSHSKAIIAIWVVVLVASVPLALKSGEVMSYDTNEMAGEGSESVIGLGIISEFFDNSQGDFTSSPIAVIHFDDSEGMSQTMGIYGALSDHYTDYKDGKSSKLSSVMAMPPMLSEDGSGILMVIITYAEGYSGSYITDDTPDLRAFISGVVSDYAHGEDLDAAVYITGNPAISHDMSAGAMEDISRIDPFTVLLILLLVGLFFRSFVTSATPPITIGFAFVVVLALIFALGQVLNIFFITEMMLLVSMMGAGCDYCIFIIARYREELRSGRPHEEALHEAVAWAGESIATSGASVIIGFGAMAVCSYSLVSTMGICLALGILVALLAALTLIPAILAQVGDRVFWPSKMDSFREGGKSTRGWYAACGRLGQKYFDRSARFSLKHAKAIAIVTVLVSVPAAYIAVTSETSYDMVSSMQSGESGEGMDLLGEYTSGGILMPDYVVLQYESPLATIDTMKVDDFPIGIPALRWTDAWPSAQASLVELKGQLEADENIAFVTIPYLWDESRDEALAEGKISLDKPEEAIEYLKTDSGLSVSMVVEGIEEQLLPMMELYISKAHPELTPEQVHTAACGIMLLQMGPFIDYSVNVSNERIGGYFDAETKPMVFVKVSVSTVAAAMSPRSMESISTIESIVDGYMEEYGDMVKDKWVTGTAVVMYEVSEVISGEFTMIEVLVVVLIIILLLVVMRSYTIPFRSILTILMSIAWTLTITHFLFENVLGAEVMWLIPLILLVICLGLGMDYDILLTTRIKENVKSRGMTNDEAIYHAVTHTGSVITVCGLIMGGAFGTLMMSGMVMMQQFGFALCFAILVDALVVRTYIVPAIMHLLGDWNWKGPGSKAPDRGRLPNGGRPPLSPFQSEIIALASVFTTTTLLTVVKVPWLGVTLDAIVLVAFILYFAMVLLIGFYFYGRSNNLGDYILGGRSMNPYVTALSAQASDMSSWLLMGLPGAVMLMGLGEAWIGIGLALGSYLSWLFVAKKLRKHSVVAGNSLTVPEFFSNRYKDHRGHLRLIASVIILFFFVIYVASGFKGCGVILTTIFPELGLEIAMGIGAAIIILYTFMGGYKAVCWTDFVQGLLMLVAVVVVPLAAIGHLGGWGEAMAALDTVDVDHFTDLFWDGGKPLSFIAILSLMAWAFGYFGMPHIVVRYMSIRDPEEVKVARRVSLIWITIALAAAILIGIIGRAYMESQGGIPEGFDAEHIFITMAGDMFVPIIAGLLYAAVMAAIMSTADSQLLVASSAITNDLLANSKTRKFDAKILMWISRVVVIIVAIIALALAMYGGNNIMGLVSYAWAGFGAAFGPLMILSLYWKRMNIQGATAALIVGFATVILWNTYLTGPTGVYELLPGFIFSLIAGIVVSLMTPPPSEEIQAEFDQAQLPLEPQATE